MLTAGTADGTWHGTVVTPGAQQVAEAEFLHSVFVAFLVVAGHTQVEVLALIVIGNAISSNVIRQSTVLTSVQ